MARINFNGQDYGSVDEMPPDVRRVYQRLMGVFADEDGDGTPDIFEFASPPRQYRSADELPPKARKLHDEMFAMLPDDLAREEFLRGPVSYQHAKVSDVTIVGGLSGARRTKPGGLANWIIGLALMALFAGGGMALFSAIMRSSESYDIAFARARSSPEVLAVFGEPLTAGWWTTGKISSGGSLTSVRYQVPVSGPLQDGRMSIAGSERRGDWDLTVTLTYERGGETRAIRLDE